MRTSDFDYELPPELIAQERAQPPESARMLVLDRTTGAISHQRISDLPSILRPDDVLVFNDSRVIPARLHGHKLSGGKVELLLVRPVGSAWLALAHPGLRPGQTVVFSAPVRPDAPADQVDARLEARVMGIEADGLRRIEFDAPAAQLPDLLAQVGSMPTPPYINRPIASADEYQTIYARIDGSVAAPTAGFHFSRRLLEAFQRRGIALEFVTLHVGPGTFRPVKTDSVEEHVLHQEWYAVDEPTATRLNDARNQGRRLIAIGTTTVRTLETVADPTGRIHPGRGDTRIFIYPGYRFKAIDGLLTNFHLPRSTLLMLVSAFAGRECVFGAYRAAVAARYRFYSFGDAMLIL